jgi:hypothetical protein
MAAETVRIYTVDESSLPLAGVLVRFFDDSDVFVTQQYSALVGSEVYAEVTLDGDDPPNEYTIRLSKTGVAFDGSLGGDSKTPQSIEIYSPASAAPTGTNDFRVQGQTFVRPSAMDPRLCRCSGFFLDHSGRPLRNLEIVFIAICYNEDQADWNPLIVDGNGVLGNEIYTRTDTRGYISIDLFRTGEYAATVQGLEHSRRVLKVPDQPSMNLIDLLFPVVHEVVFDPDPLALSSGSYVDVDLSITASDGQELDASDQDLTFSSSNTAIATTQLLVNNKLRVMGVGVGSTTIVATRTDQSIVTIPSEPVHYTPLAVTVS